MALGLRYAKSSVAYLAAGSTLVFLTFAGLLQFSIFGFYFMELYGFVASMIFGVSYLMIPAFAHRPLHSVRLAQLQYWIFNAGTVGLTIGFSGLFTGIWVRSVQVSAFLLQTVAVYFHAYNIWRTTGGWKGSPGEALTKLET
jgi:cbb3-type cytochrome oxidase subunit 1